MRLLLVDDSEFVLAAVTRDATARGWTVSTSASAAEARTLGARAFDAAVLDLEIGDESGIDLATHLRNENPGLKIAFLTGTTDDALRRRAEAVALVFDKTSGMGEVSRWLDTAREQR
ncbi:MAG: response regulator [Polyangiaceae bacterium]|nr:response regulator [Polyangiaceae bacterium]